MGLWRECSGGGKGRERKRKQAGVRRSRLANCGFLFSPVGKTNPQSQDNKTFVSLSSRGSLGCCVGHTLGVAFEGKRAKIVFRCRGGGVTGEGQRPWPAGKKDGSCFLYCCEMWFEFLLACVNCDLGVFYLPRAMQHNTKPHTTHTQAPWLRSARREARERTHDALHDALFARRFALSLPSVLSGC